MGNPVITTVVVGNNYSVNDSARVHASLQLTMIVDPASLRVNFPTTVSPTFLLVRTAGGNQSLSVPAPTEQTATIATGGITRSIRWQTADVGSTRQLMINVEDPAFSATNELWTLQISALPPATSITIAILDQATITQIEADPVIDLVTPIQSGKESEVKPLQARAGRYTMPPLPIPAPLPMGCPGVTMSWSQMSGDPVVGTLTPAVPTSTTFPNPNGTTIIGCERNANVTLPGLGSTPSVTLNYRIEATIGAFSNSKTATVTVATRTRHAILVLDRSGSMSGEKWDNAVKGAYIWLDLLTAFRRGINANDRVGIMTFTDDACEFSADDTKISSDIEVVFPTVGALGSLPLPPAPASLSLGEPDSCTPIGDGLVRALDRMVGLLEDSNPSLNDPQRSLYGILLLTDGIENSGTVKVDPVSTTLGGVELFNSIRNTGARSIFRFKPDPNPNTQLYTVGVGSDGSVRPEVLSRLAYGDVAIPSAPNGYYRLVSNVRDLIPSLAEMLSKFLTAAHMDVFTTPPPFTTPVASGVPDADNPPAGTAVYFRIPAGEQKLVVVLLWNSSGDDLELTWRSQPIPSASASSFNVVSPSSAIVVAKRESHGVASINDLSSVSPGGTEWRVRYKPGGGAPAVIDLTNVLAARDLRVRTEIIFDRAQYRTEQPMKIEARLFAGSEPITEGRVVVELARPGESLGTFLVVNSALITQPRPTATTTNLTTSATTIGKGDPLSPKVALLQQILNLKDMSALSVLTPQTIFVDGTNELYDGGSVNDGIYANTYTKTDMEGTYTFRFHMSGRTPDGSYFADTITLSRWVGVNVDPTASIVTIQTGISVDNRRFLGARVSVIPKSPGGQYLGPFWSNIVRFTTTAGSFQGNIVSEPDGSYSQLLLYRPGELPIITVEVDGQKFPPKPIAGGCLSILLGIPFLRWLLRLLGLIS